MTETWEEQLRPGTCGQRMLEESITEPWFTDADLYNIAVDKDASPSKRALAAKLYVAEKRLGWAQSLLRESRKTLSVMPTPHRLEPSVRDEYLGITRLDLPVPEDE